MLIGGLQKFTALDYPGKIAATVFTVGCNFRCPFCHNGEIVKINDSDSFEEIAELEVLEFLRSRAGELDGVCISGGEPTLQTDLIPFMETVKNMGFLVKLDTNGFNTEIVKEIAHRNIVDYFAIDIKTSFGKYHLVNAPEAASQRVLETISFIIESEIPLELRTTVVPGIVETEDFDGIIEGINGKNKKILRNLTRYCVQAFRPQKCLDKSFEKVDPYEDKVLEEIVRKLQDFCQKVDILK